MVDGDYRVVTDPVSGSISFQASNLVGYEEDFDFLMDVANGLMNELPAFDGMMQNNDHQQIRLGIIQDPGAEIFDDRTDAQGNPKMGAYSVIDQNEQQYPFNGLNSFDPVGMRVSVVWVDGYDGGLYQGTNDGNPKNQTVTIKSTLQRPVQKIWLTFQNCWSDMDRSSGSFRMPLAGTLVRIGMGRGNVGVYLGAVPLNRANLPICRMGDHLDRHYNQSVYYMTDTSTADAYKNVLDKDIFRKEFTLEPKTAEDKPYETNSAVLEDLHKYQPNRHVIAEDGISSSVKIESGKHGSVDGKRVTNYETKLGLEDGIDQWSEALPNGLEDLITLNMVSPEGVLQVCRVSNTQQSVSLVSKLTLDASLTFVRKKFAPSSCKIVAQDGVWEFTSTPTPPVGNTSAILTKPSHSITSTSLTLSQIASLVTEHFVALQTYTVEIRASDALVNWCRQSGTSRSSFLSAFTQQTHIEAIMGRPGKYYYIYGPDAVLVGNPIVSDDCVPPPEIPINTCEVPLTN